MLNEKDYIMFRKVPVTGGYIIIGTERHHCEDYDFVVGYEGQPTEITIPDGVVGIDDFAFEDCKSLISVTMPATLTKIGFRPFFGCCCNLRLYVTRECLSKVEDLDPSNLREFSLVIYTD